MVGCGLTNYGYYFSGKDAYVQVCELIIGMSPRKRSTLKKVDLGNEEIAQILMDMSAFWDMDGVEYKRRAYEMAAADVKIFRIVFPIFMAVRELRG
jgi:hypothetical protein